MKDFPLIKFVILFIAGLVLQRIFQFPLLYAAIALLLLIVVSITVHYAEIFGNKKYLLSLLSVPVVILTGTCYIAIDNLNQTYYPFEKARIKNIKAYGTVTGKNLPEPDSYSFNISIDSLVLDSSVFNGNLNLLVRYYDSSRQNLTAAYELMSVGNEVRLSGTLRKARDKRNPGEFDYYSYLSGKGIGALYNITGLDDIHILDDGIDPVADIIDVTRYEIHKRITVLHTAEASALLKGLLLADRGEIDDAIKEKYINAGVVHVLAVSGLHVGYIILIFLILGGRFILPIRYCLTIFGLTLFLIITGAPSSVFRASVMSIIMLVSLMSRRSTNPFNSLSFAALLLLIINPRELFDPGFQLSFSAVISILIFYPRFRRLIASSGITNRLIIRVLLFIAVSISAQIGTLPFTLIYFKKLSIISILANLVVIPLIGTIVALGILTLIVSMFFMLPAYIFASANNLIIELLNKFISFGGSLKYSHLTIPDFTLYDTVIFYVFVISAITLWERLRHKKSKALFSVLLPIVVILFIKFDDRDLMPANSLSIIGIDIGQGDAFLVKFPNSKTALIDAGNATPYFDNGERVIKPLLQNFGIGKVDIGFISHVDADHYKGFLTLIKSGLIGKIYKPPLDSSSVKDIELEEIIREMNIPIEYYSRGIISVGNCRVYILNDTLEGAYKRFDSNDKSGVIKLVYGSNSFLFTGDAGTFAEKLLIEKYGSFLESDLLKVGHHGSSSSTGEEFLTLVKPKYAMISAGPENPYNHPSPGVISLLKKYNVEIARTDKECALLFRSDGTNIERIDWKNFRSSFLLN